MTFTNISHESGCAPGSKTFGKFASFAASGFTVSQRCCNNVIKKAEIITAVVLILSVSRLLTRPEFV